MKYLRVAAGLSAVLLMAGCATKKFVAKTTAPINQKVDEQKQALNETNDSLQKTQRTLTEDETKLSATDERARTADSRAGDALNRAGEANSRATEASGKADAAAQQADKANRGVNDALGKIAGLDDFKEVGKATVAFKFNSDKLDEDARRQLDEISQDHTKFKRYFVSVEGFTDHTGADTYNKALSQRRADVVVTYLVTQHEIPVYRIQMLGLGKANPIDDGHGREANAKNRRVEVTFYSSDTANPAQ
jgi:outer membrane protein OmpA-like peptidoglycan-associated protein